MSTIPLLQTLGWGTIYNLAFQLFLNSPAYELEINSMSQSSRLRQQRLLILFFGVGTLFFTGVCPVVWPTSMVVCHGFVGSVSLRRAVSQKACYSSTHKE